MPHLENNQINSFLFLSPSLGVDIPVNTANHEEIEKSQDIPFYIENGGVVAVEESGDGI